MTPLYFIDYIYIDDKLSSFSKGIKND